MKYILKLFLLLATPILLQAQLQIPAIASHNMVLHQNLFASIAYVSDDKSSVVMFTYLHNNRFMQTAKERPVKLNSLEPAKKYRVTEINLHPGTASAVKPEVCSGDYLMSVGINPDVNLRRTSVVLEFSEVN